MQTIILICLIIWSVLEPTQNLALIIGVGLAKPTPMINAKFCVGSRTLQIIRQIKIIVCIKRIIDFRCPILFVKKGNLIRSIIGAHKKLNA